MGGDVHVTVVDERAVGLETGDVELAGLYVDGRLGIVADVVVAVDGCDVHLLGGDGERGARGIVGEGCAGGGQFRLFILKGLYAAVGFGQARHGGDGAVEGVVDRGQQGIELLGETVEFYDGGAHGQLVEGERILHEEQGFHLADEGGGRGHGRDGLRGERRDGAGGGAEAVAHFLRTDLRRYG